MCFKTCAWPECGADCSEFPEIAVTAILRRETVSIDFDMSQQPETPGEQEVPTGLSSQARSASLALRTNHHRRAATLPRPR
jgi:hypothetical protein